MVLDYGEGRIFHTTPGHDDQSMEGVGFIVSFTRGTAWAATGKVTQGSPAISQTQSQRSSGALS